MALILGGSGWMLMIDHPHEHTYVATDGMIGSLASIDLTITLVSQQRNDTCGICDSQQDITDQKRIRHRSWFCEVLAPYPHQSARTMLS
jgi:hypothetical protein